MQPTNFHWISEDRRRAILDRRAEMRGRDRREQATRFLDRGEGVAVIAARVVDQEAIRAELLRAGMIV